MTMNNKAAAVIAMMVLPFPGLASAQGSGQPGWYAGGGLSLNDVYSYDEYCPYCYGSTIYGDSGVGGVITGGYRFSKFFAVEATYSAESSMHWRKSGATFETLSGVYALDADVTVSSFQVGALGLLAGELWEGYLKIGLALWDGSAEQQLVQLGTGQSFSRVVDSDGEEFLLGIGVGRKFSDRIKVRLDYAFHGIDGELLGIEDPEGAYTDYAALQILYSFGPLSD